ncbi:MAG: peptide deformylase [Bdellovibrionales bacterium CG10_big_fil_rev_8_21_14_0_10_45_34]|nr:MAG: peptide deformylase [Bdellovibrionales bacterium CG10_big_fil_rev_8_21_14_0_10_45_34]
MAIRKVARMGHPVLRQPARTLSKNEILSDEIQRLIADMFDTMTEYGGVGLAAPQVHEPYQLAVIDIQEDNERYPNQVKSEQFVIINPVIKVLDETAQGFWEGCLSVPGLRGFVERPRKVSIDFLDHKAQPRTVVAEDFLATVFQHELDHLFATLYVDRIKDPTKFAFTEEFQRYHTDDDELETADE